MQIGYAEIDDTKKYVVCSPHIRASEGCNILYFAIHYSASVLQTWRAKFARCILCCTPCKPGSKHLPLVSIRSRASESQLDPQPCVVPHPATDCDMVILKAIHTHYMSHSLRVPESCQVCCALWYDLPMPRPNRGIDPFCLLK